MVSGTKETTSMGFNMEMESTFSLTVRGMKASTSKENRMAKASTSTRMEIGMRDPI